MKRTALAGTLASAALALTGLAVPATGVAAVHHSKRNHVKAHIALLHRELDRAFVALPR